MTNEYSLIKESSHILDIFMYIAFTTVIDSEITTIAIKRTDDFMTFERISNY